ncbi:MAG: phospholipid carrier-dependent glycosyltransferase [archaeon]|nr:phospholipid carrier-dependent glycosyltransferase [archaeon]
MSLDREKLLYGFLVFAILLGVFARFWDLDSALFWRDEPIHFIAALKMNHHDYSINREDPRFWFLEHPQVATFSMGFLTRFIQIDYTDIILMTKHYGYLYVPFEILKQTFYSIRLMSAVFGTLVVALVFFITRHLWSTKSALWSTALVSLSLAFVGISRISFLEIFMIGYFLLSLVFFLKFLDAKSEKSKLLFLLLTGFFIVLTLGTRWGPPFLLYPVLFFSFLLFPQNRKNKKWVTIFVICLLMAFPIFYFYILNPQVIDIILGKISTAVGEPVLGVGAPEPNIVFKIMGTFERVFGQLFRNNLFSVTGSFFYMHSYFFLFSFLAFIAYYFSRVFDFKRFSRSFNSKKGLVYSATHAFSLSSVTNFLRNPDKRIVMFLFFVFSLVFFEFSYFGGDLRYFTILFIPVAVLMGKPLALFSQKKWAAIVLVLLVLLNLFSLVQYFPNYLTYGNFGTTDFQVIDYYNSYDLLPQQEEILNFLEEEGNPRIFTNLPNMLVFYKGEVLPVPPSDSRLSAYKICELDFAKETENSYIVMLVYDGKFSNNLYREKPWYCEKFMELKVKSIKEYGLIYEDGKPFPFGTISIFKPGSSS